LLFFFILSLSLPRFLHALLVTKGLVTFICIIILRFKKNQSKQMVPVLVGLVAVLFLSAGHFILALRRASAASASGNEKGGQYQGSSFSRKSNGSSTGADAAGGVTAAAAAAAAALGHGASDPLSAAYQAQLRAANSQLEAERAAR